MKPRMTVRVVLTLNAAATVVMKNVATITSMTPTRTCFPCALRLLVDEAIEFFTPTGRLTGARWMKENTGEGLYYTKSGLASMDTLIRDFPGGPARHGDTLSNKFTPTDIREILGEDTSQRVSAACSFMSLQAQIRRDQSARNFFNQMAAVFRVQ